MTKLFRFPSVFLSLTFSDTVWGMMQCKILVGLILAISCYRHAIGRQKFVESSTTGLSRIVYMVTFKSLVGKTAKIFQLNQNFALYSSYPVCVLCWTDDSYSL